MLLKIPVKPLSINKAWRGRRFKTPEYKQFEIDCSWWIKGKMIKGEIDITYRFYLKNYARTDLDNLIKNLQDIIVKCGMIEDDRKIKRLVAEKFKSDEDRIEVDIKKYS